MEIPFEKIVEERTDVLVEKKIETEQEQLIEKYVEREVIKEIVREVTVEVPQEVRLSLSPLPYTAQLCRGLKSQKFCGFLFWPLQPGCIFQVFHFGFSAMFFSRLVLVHLTQVMSGNYVEGIQYSWAVRKKNCVP